MQLLGPRSVSDRVSQWQPGPVEEETTPSAAGVDGEDRHQKQKSHPDTASDRFSTARSVDPEAASLASDTSAPDALCYNVARTSREVHSPELTGQSNGIKIKTFILDIPNSKFLLCSRLL